MIARWFKSWPFQSLVGGHQQPLKGSQKTIPKRSPAELPGVCSWGEMALLFIMQFQDLFWKGFPYLSLWTPFSQNNLMSNCPTGSVAWNMNLPTGEASWVKNNTFHTLMIKEKNIQSIGFVSTKQLWRCLCPKDVNTNIPILLFKKNGLFISTPWNALNVRRIWSNPAKKHMIFFWGDDIW